MMRKYALDRLDATLSPGLVDWILDFLCLFVGFLFEHVYAKDREALYWLNVYDVL